MLEQSKHLVNISSLTALSKICFFLFIIKHLSHYNSKMWFWYLLTQSCPTLCAPMDCSLSGSSVHGIFLARMLEGVAMPSSRGSSRSRNWTPVSCVAGWFLTCWTLEEAPNIYSRCLQWWNPDANIQKTWTITLFLEIVLSVTSIKLFKKPTLCVGFTK